MKVELAKLELLYIIFILATFVSCQESLKERCAREAEEYTARNCPQKIGMELILDSVTFTEDANVMGYHYTATGTLDDAEMMKTNYTRFRDLMKHEIRNSANLKPYKDAGFSFEYTYTSQKDKNILLVLRIEEKDYKVCSKNSKMI